MKILLLSNSAPNYYHFFNSLAKRFETKGARVVAAADSHFSSERNQLDATGFDIHVFSEYFSSHQTDPELLATYAHENLNAALLSDFERAQVYDIWGHRDTEFFDRLKSALLSFFETLFTQYAVDTVLYENVSNTFSHFALFVARRYGARYLGIGGSRLPGRFSVTSDPLADTEVEQTFQAIRSGSLVVSKETRRWCEDYLKNIETAVPDYMKINRLDDTRLFKRYFNPETLGRLIAAARYSENDAYHAFQVGRPLRTLNHLFARNVRRRMKLPIVSRLYEAPRDGERFLLYPLHFHPESSTSILAGTYLNEYEVIRNIAFNLPEGMRLYVKDHVSAWGYPSLAFYRDLKRLPNVRLLAPTSPTKQLIRRSEAVITLTSTVGYEALLMGKKVFLFGSVFYQFHEQVVRVGDPTQLFDLLRTELNSDTRGDMTYNLDFIAAYYLSTLPGSLNLMQTGEAAAHMADSVYASINMLEVQRPVEQQRTQA